MHKSRSSIAGHGSQYYAQLADAPSGRCRPFADAHQVLTRVSSSAPAGVFCIVVTSRTTMLAALTTFSGSLAYSTRYTLRVLPACNSDCTEYTRPEFLRRSTLSRVE